MKKIISFMLVIALAATIFPTCVIYAEDDFISQLSDMVKKYEEDTYFSEMSVTIGEPLINIDGENVRIDDSGSTPYIENGRTMMPVRGLAEAIGAEVSYDNKEKKVIVSSDETMVMMTIGEEKMEVNGEVVELLTPPEIVNNRTMLPIRDVAEALDCEVEWIAETETAVFTRPLQTKRVIAFSENAKDSDAVMSVRGNGMTIMQFDSVEDAKDAIGAMEKKGITAEPDCVRKIDAMSWGIGQIGSEKYYNQVGYASGSAVVAVADTGVDLSHSYFSGRLVKGYDVYDNDSDPQDEQTHGTHVASTVLDVAGFNPNIKIMPVKIFGKEDSTYASIIASGIRYAVDNGADVINLSVGGIGVSETEQSAIDYAYKNNVAVVAAAGNSKLDLRVYGYSPASLNHVITVSAMDESGNLASFSNYGDGVVEFTAPGQNIKGAIPGGSYGTKSGTSMASPHVAGAYAIVIAAHPGAKVDEITRALGKNATNKGNSNYFGYGLINVASFEKHMSQVSCKDTNIEDVGKNSATVKGTIKYSGIKPRYIGVSLGKQKNNMSDVAKINFSESGKNFEYTLDSLSEGTTYYANIFVEAGGIRYDMDKVTFTTSGEKAPEPEPAPSDLRILPDKYPTGSITEGSVFVLKGTIKSNYNITDVRAYILDSNKNAVIEAKEKTSTKSYSIEGSTLDNGMKFNNLAKGKYYLRYTAADESGNTASWTSGAFTVEGKTGKSDLRILPDKYPTGSIKEGSVFVLTGRIKSDCHITDVRAYILDVNKKVVMEASGWTTTQTYVIEHSALDNGMRFNDLPKGTYYLKYTAADESGNTASWTSGAFTVEGKTGKSDLRILPDKYPTGSIAAGKAFVISGRIKSDCHITDVRAYILDSNKKVVMEASGWTTTQTYVIEHSALDNGMRFNDLPKGAYYLKYTAADESGNTASWTSDLFYVQ